MAFVPPKALRDYVGKWAKEHPEEVEDYKKEVIYLVILQVL